MRPASPLSLGLAQNVLRGQSSGQRSGLTARHSILKRQDALGRDDMQPLDHMAVDPQNALCCAFGVAESRNDLAGPSEFLRIRTEDLVADLHLGRVHASLAVHAEIAP